MIWFTSDTHYGHTNIAGPKVSSWDGGFRNFESVQEMNEALINNINKCVGEDDILYHLGDWSFGGSANIEIFRRQLKCKNIHLLYGNHDKNIKRDYSYYKSLFLTQRDVFTGEINKIQFHLTHYSHQVWPDSHRGTIHLFGHSHGSLNGKEVGKSMDVGIDCHPEFRPFSFDEVIELVSKKEVQKIDHHI